MRIILKNFVNTLLHYKVSSILNVVGLALAFASMYILLVQVNWELTYNHSIQDADRVFAVELKDDFTEGEYSHFIARPFMDRLTASASYIEALGTEGDQSERRTFTLLRGDTKEHFKMDYSRVSLPFLDVMGFKNLEGDVHNICKPNTVAIPETIAAKFGLTVGDILEGKLGDQKISSEIVAVYKNFADNTLLSKNPIIADMGNQSIDNYTSWNFCYYVKLKSAADKEKFEALYLEKFKQLTIDEGSNNEELGNLETRLVPLKEMYFHDGESTSARGNKNIVYTLLSIAVLIVVIALINFVNFFYALIPVRIRKVNTLKIFGSPMYALRINFVTEALGLVLISLLIAWYLVYIVQASSFAEYISTSLSLSRNPFVLIVTIVSALLVAIAASTYPAYYITSFPMAFVIKGSFAASRSGKILRTSLLGIQFVISISLIVSAIFMRVQNNYMINYDMGFNKENVFSVWVTGKIAGKNSKACSEKLLVNPQIKAVAWAQGGIVSDTRMTWGRNVKNQYVKFSCFPVSPDFLKVMGIDILEGRDFTEADNLKEKGTFIFNESAKKEYNFTLDDKVGGHNGDTDIVGFCKDYNFLPLQYGISPMALYLYGANSWGYLSHLYIRTEANADMKEVIDYIKTTMVEFDPTISKEEVDVVFFDEELGRLYYKEEKLTTLITLFSIVSIVISLMGVFGLVLFETQYRRKEIGIRRVHGASRREILAMFNRKYITLVLVCFVIAVPISYYFLHQWVSGFAYRAPMAWWIFALALLLVLLITIATVTIRSMKAANEDPANSIKTE